MKVAFLTTTMFSRTNGPAVFACNLYDSYIKSKQLNNAIEIAFITEDVITEPNVSLVTTKASSFFKRVGMILKAYEYYKVLKKMPYDIAVWNFSILGWFAILSNKKSKKNVVFVNDPYSLNASFRISYKYFRLKIFGFFESYSCKNSNHVITNSEVIKAEILSKYGIDAKNISVLYKGIDCNTNGFLKLNWDIDVKTKIKVVFVKSDYISGGLELLYDSLLLLPDFKFELVVIGPNAISDYFINETNIETRLLGRLKNKSKFYYEMVSSDIFCVPNKNEAFGQANCESMMLQIPTIILPTKYQLALHNESYCWIPKEISKTGLADTIKDIIVTSSYNRELKSKKARQVILREYSFEKTKNNFYKILNQVRHV